MKNILSFQGSRYYVIRQRQSSIRVCQPMEEGKKERERERERDRARERQRERELE